MPARVAPNGVNDTPPLANTASRSSSARRKRKNSVGALGTLWAKFMRRVGTGTAPSTSSLIDDSAEESQAVPMVEGPVPNDNGMVDEVVVDRTWSEDITKTDSDHDASPGESGGSQRATGSTSGDDSEDYDGLWAALPVGVLLRWRIWPAIVKFFSASFSDTKSEAHYAQESWFIKKSLALPLVQVFDQVIYYGVAPLLTIPIMYADFCTDDHFQTLISYFSFMVMYDWPRDKNNIYQIFLTFSVWLWPFYSVLFMLLSLPILSQFTTCPLGLPETRLSGNLLLYHSIAGHRSLWPQIESPAGGNWRKHFFCDWMLFDDPPEKYLGQKYARLLIQPGKAGADSDTIQGMINFFLFHSFLIYVHYMTESSERRLYTLRDQLKVQYKVSPEQSRAAVLIASSPGDAKGTMQNMAASGTVAKEQDIEFDALTGSLSMMSKVLNDVLDFNRMDSGRFESVCLPLRLETKARGLDFETELDPRIDQIARLASYKALDSDEERIRKHMSDFPNESGIVIGDEARLRQIVTNLASNACKFTPVGGKLFIKTQLVLPADFSTAGSPIVPVISSASDFPYRSSEYIGHPPLSASHLSQHNSESRCSGQDHIVVRIEVTDTGYGIKPRDVMYNKLFSAFNQTEQGRLQGGKGTGLGLALVRQIVKLSGGRLGLKSKLNEGSTFWVELPLGVGSKTLINSNRLTTGSTSATRGSGIDLDMVQLDESKHPTPMSLESSFTLTVDATTLEAPQPQPKPDPSKAAIQDLVEQRDIEVEANLRRQSSRSSVKRCPDAPSPSEQPVSVDTPGDTGQQSPPMEGPPKKPKPRPTYVPMPRPRSFNMDTNPTNASNTSKTSDPLAQFDAAYSRSSPTAGPPPIDLMIEPALPVLVVDDDAVTRILMTRLLTRLGCHVTTAENGQVALEMILGPVVMNKLLTLSNEASGHGPIPEQRPEYKTEGKFAVIFLDNQMPILSGLKTVRKLRLLGRADLVVGVTDQDEYLEAGVNRVLTKPVSEQSLRDMLILADEHLLPTHVGVHLSDLDTKLSRKREREVSLEPVSTPKSIVDNDAPREHKDTRTPAKKNRTRLDATEEEEDVSRSRSNSGSPPLSVSPPHEMKIRVRQISQGVEDINWRNIKAVNSDRDIETDPIPTSVAVEQDKDGDEASDGPADSEGEPNGTISKSHELTIGSIKASNSIPAVEMAESESGDKSLKRKLSERGTSQGPPDSTQSPSEPLKRARDDDEKDENPRETKRPSPPPEPKAPRSPKKAPATVAATSKLSGFMAYASPNSPFSAVKGQNIFASNKAVSPPPENRSLATPMTIFGSADASGSSLTPAMKRTGFEAFASPLSPFASASRSKSPVLGATSKLGRAKSPVRRGNSMNSTAFSSYAGGLQSFAVPPPKRARAGTPSSSVDANPALGVFGGTDNGAVSDSGEEDDKDEEGSFGAKLRAGKDDDDEGYAMDKEYAYHLTEQDVLTGEEDEQTVHQVRGKLFSLVDGNQWKERGTGTLKLNVKRSDGSGARLVMRKEAVYTLLLNVTLFPGMRCSLAQDPRYLRLSVIEEGATTHYNLRLANAKIAKELLEEIIANIP
ncbi:hypothetical protein DXG01_002877 [Tephrocybe rancida]|nr:hypothetical protein DXG01_002877 [Tephrocybe rancida]